MTTHQMIEALERDRSASDRDMTATEDSVYVFMGDSIAALLKQAHASWEQYRRAECDAIRVAFSGGSMARGGHLECWVDLTDDHGKFMAAEYGYMRNGGMPPAPRPR